MKAHAKLRAAMVEADVDGRYLARKLGRGTAYVSIRMMGHESWELDECYTILDLLRIPYDKLAEYFPPRGLAQKKTG